MQSPLQAPSAATDPKSVKVNLTTGTGVDIEWADGHVSHYGFVYLRDACPCAMCNEERDKARRKPGEPAKPGAGRAAYVQTCCQAGFRRSHGEIRDPLQVE